jgi:hypothetical protein
MSYPLPPRWEQQDQPDLDGYFTARDCARAVAMSTPTARRTGAVEAGALAVGKSRAVRARGSHQRPLMMSMAHDLAALAGVPHLTNDVLDAIKDKVGEVRRADGLDKVPTRNDGAEKGAIRTDESVRDSYGPPGNLSARRGRKP